jgi:tyrosyl-tRNA synthetase
MARSVVDLYHGAGAGARAEAGFDVVHREREIPRDVEDRRLQEDWGKGGLYWLPRVLWEVGLAGSKSEAKRLIDQGGVRLDGDLVTDPEREFRRDELLGKVLQLGRRRFVRLT